MSEDKVPPFLAKAKPIVRKIDEVCAKYGVNRVALAMSFVKQQKSISSLVFGVDKPVNGNSYVPSVAYFDAVNGFISKLITFNASPTCQI